VSTTAINSLISTTCPIDIDNESAKGCSNSNPKHNVKCALLNLDSLAMRLSGLARYWQRVRFKKRFQTSSKEWVVESIDPADDFHWQENNKKALLIESKSE
jgi:hypothetical protein